MSEATTFCDSNCECDSCIAKANQMVRDEEKDNVPFWVGYLSSMCTVRGVVDEPAWPSWAMTDFDQADAEAQRNQMLPQEEPLWPC